MWKLTFNLCVVIFVTLIIAGRDHGAPIVQEAQASKAQSSVLDLVAPTRVTPIERIAYEPEPLAAPETTPEFFHVIGTRINVRGGPSTGGEVLAKLEKDEEVMIVADNGDGWVKIRIEGDGVEGWVAASLLRPSE